MIRITHQIAQPSAGVRAAQATAPAAHTSSAIMWTSWWAKRSRHWAASRLVSLSGRLWRPAAT